MSDLIERQAAIDAVKWGESVLSIRDEIARLPTVDAIPIDWTLQRMNETSSGSGMNVELNNALFTVGVEWERWKKEHGEDGG